MFEFNQLCKEYENLSDGERKLLLQEMSAKIISAFEAINSRGMEMFMYFVGVACGADGHLSPEEYALLQQVSPIDFKYNEAKQLAEKYSSKENKESAQILSNIIGLFSEEIQDSILSFCLCFCSADKKISLSERKFIKSLIQ